MNDWIGVLENEARNRWKEQRLLLLSQIPLLLTEHDLDPRAIAAGRRWLHVLQGDAKGRLTVVQHPDRPPVLAVLPNDLDVGTDPRTIFGHATAENPIRRELGAPKYKRWFWSAFIKPLDPEQRRWLYSNGFTDRGENENPPGNAIEVIESDIKYPGADEPADVVEVTRAIGIWAERNKVTLTQYQVADTVTDDREPARRRTSLAFESLDEEDLKRIVVPLDIVMKLLRH